MRHVIAGTAGHIDHGKSALVRALTGTDPDRLKEEKLRGITIDLGFAHLELGEVNIGFVDVPGHERFVKNMLAGVGGIDFVILVIAADESIMPQTREHFEICRMLGIQAGIVVITKCDLVEPELVPLVCDEIRDLVHGSFLESAPTLVVSSKTGEGIAELVAAIQKLALRLTQRPTDRMLLLPVDRAFSMRGFGTVVTGTLTSGRLGKDEEIELIPSGIRARVRGIQVYGRASEAAVAGQRTAVNLQGVNLDDVKRGMVLTVPGIFQARQLLDVRLDLLRTARPIRNLARVRFHHGTSETLARVALLAQEALDSGKSAYAQLRLDSPTLCLHGDHFIIRQFSPPFTIGGGTVLHPHPVKHKNTDRHALEDLRQIDTSTLVDRIPALIRSYPSRAASLGELNSMLGLPEDELERLISALTSAGRIVTVPAPDPILLLPGIVGGLEEETVKKVREFHTSNPLLKGISREELRKRIFSDYPQEVFRYALDQLTEKRKIRVQEEFVCIYGREVQLSAQEEDIRQKLENIYLNAGFQPPGLAELIASVDCDPAEVKKIHFWMLKEKILVRVSEDLTYHTQTLAQIKKRIRDSLPPGSIFGVSEFKALFGFTRKHAIPLLEYLDRERITRRQGNDRLLL